jgi:hypothetical protein
MDSSTITAEITFFKEVSHGRTYPYPSQYPGTPLFGQGLQTLVYQCPQVGIQNVGKNQKELIFALIQALKTGSFSHRRF